MAHPSCTDPVININAEVVLQLLAGTISPENLRHIEFRAKAKTAFAATKAEFWPQRGTVDYYKAIDKKYKAALKELWKEYPEFDKKKP